MQLVSLNEAKPSVCVHLCVVHVCFACLINLYA